MTWQEVALVAVVLAWWAAMRYIGLLRLRERTVYAELENDAGHVGGDEIRPVNGHQTP